MTNISISLKGIDQAIDSLNYRPGSVKQAFIYAIRAFYTSEDSIKELNAIDTDTLIRSIWNIEIDAKIKAKRRNFSSLKSSVNADLKKLSKKELNPENIIICDANTFDMTDDAKNNLLSAITNSVKMSDINLDQAGKILETVTDFLDNAQRDGRDTGNGKMIDQIKEILNKIPPDVLSGESLEEIEEDESPREIDSDEDENLETIEIDEDEEFEVVEELFDETEDLEDTQEIDSEFDLSDGADVEEIGEDQGLIDEAADVENIEEVEEIDSDFEEIELDEDEELDDDNDIEKIELEEDEALEEITLDEDIETIEINEDEELEELELDDEELKALDDFREKRNRAGQFDERLGEREKKYNTYVLVPGGLYTIGTKKSLKSSLELQQFDMPRAYMGAYPVTNSLFEIFIDETGYVTTAEVSGFGRVYYSRFQKRADGSTWLKNAGSRDMKGACWFKPSGPESTLHGKRNHPVVQISVEDATAFASWIGRRLPTEAEWEAAARTDFGYAYPWGDEFNPSAFNIEQTGQADTSVVDAYDDFANPFKIADLLGNVMEWTSDMEHPPVNLTKSVKHCVAKGAAWNARADATISSRALYKPGFTSNTIGFRCISEVLL